MSVTDILIRSRPRFWLYLAGPVLVGAVFGAKTPAALVYLEPIILFGYFLLPANLFLYGINDIYDAEIDRENPKKSGREIRYRGRALTKWLVVLTAGLGVLILPVFPPSVWPWIVGFLLIGAAYSTPPLRLKTRPPLDSISNGLYILPGIAAYTALAGTPPPPFAIVGGWLWAMAMHTFSAIPDIEPDRRAGIRTTATVLGHQMSVLYCGVTWLLAAGAFALIDYRLGLVLFSYPSLLALIVRVDIPIDRAYWWYPAINTVTGAVLTLGGLWRLLYG